MAKDLDRNHYSRRVLDLAERTQELIGNSRAGKALINVTNGSRHPNYIQLDWFSKQMSANINDSATVVGDQKAGLLPRFWMHSMILEVATEEIEELMASNPGSHEAIAYMSEGVTHVGTQRDAETGILTASSPEASAIAMRLGRRSLDATVGIWTPAERHFESVDNVEVADHSVHIDDLARQHPRMSLA
ncbi:MAG TPA: hypothetical protein VFX79_02665 [Candidatus Saccharimonadales bacterium]|nr:hypothetical protein [Candidatus Saccharimonadales bacterium]